MITPNLPTITHYCGQPLSELSREELESIVKEAAAELEELRAENGRLRRSQFGYGRGTWI